MEGGAFRVSILDEDQVWGVAEQHSDNLKVVVSTRDEEGRVIRVQVV